MRQSVQAPYRREILAFNFAQLSVPYFWALEYTIELSLLVFIRVVAIESVMLCAGASSAPSSSVLCVSVAPSCCS